MTEDIKVIPIEQLERNFENVNVMGDIEFNDLVTKIKKRGFDQPLKVWWNDTIKKYEVIKGNHRFEAAKFLGFTELPCIVGIYEHRDDALADSMSDNITRGQIDPEKFTKEYGKMKSKYGIDKVMDMMSISSHKTLASLIKEARAMLPDDLKAKFDEAKKNIKDIDDLALTINTLYNEYGHTLDCGFMFFNFGGQIHLMIKMTKRLRILMEQVTHLCETEKVNISYILDMWATTWLRERGRPVSDVETPIEEASPELSGDPNLTPKENKT